MRTRELDRNNFGNDFWQDFSSVRANASPGHALPYYNHNYIPEKVVCELHFNVGRFFNIHKINVNPRKVYVQKVATRVTHVITIYALPFVYKT